MRATTRAFCALAIAAAAAVGAVGPAAAEPASLSSGVLPTEHRDTRRVRVATYDVGLTRGAPGELVADLETGADPQAAAIAEVLQITRPDVVVLTGVDHDAEGRAVALLQDRYFRVPQHGEPPVGYGYVYSAPVNAGVPSGVDLDGSGTVGGSGDALGPGDFPGQGGMVVLSRYPIATEDVRTFGSFLWKDMPGALLPDDPTTPEPADWYSPAELERLPLSSRSHWDVPITVRGTRIHVLAANPVGAGADGIEDRNGRRNHDEIRLLADYVTGGQAASYIRDDEGVAGGLPEGEAFLLAGNLNADPADGDSTNRPAALLLEHRLVRDTRPTSPGAREAARVQRGANSAQSGRAAHDTADLPDATGPGNLRLDYVLPSRDLTVRESGVFWPAAHEPGSELTGIEPFPTSEHRLVWVDLAVGAH